MTVYRDPRQLARKIEKWAEAGFDYAIVQGGRQALDEDKRESIARAPSRSGGLRRTIRVIAPTVKRAAKYGIVRIGLSAGSRSLGHPVRYAAVHQRGLVGYPPKPKTKEHVIETQAAGSWHARVGARGRWVGRQASGKVLSFVWRGQRRFFRRVQHPGSRFKAVDYLKVNQNRAARTVDESVGRSAHLELG